MNDPRGSIWRKWDLHVHTPASLAHNYDGADPWPQFLDDLEHLPPEFKVIGINDYIFLDGYRRILAEKQSGRLANIDLFLPVIELRLDKFGGSQGHLSRVNYHVIFSNELSPDLIEQQFLNALTTRYTLTPQYEHFRTSGEWKALPTRASLSDLGQRIIDSVPEKEKKNFNAPLIEGFNNLCLNLTAISDAITSHYFTGKYATAVGKTEWADIKWNDHSIADKKHIINEATFVFAASATAEHWKKAHQSLLQGGVNAHLLDCSDAHSLQSTSNKDRLGQCLTWVKADTTFQGLLQLSIEFDERHWVGDIPPQVARVRKNPTKYMHSIEIKRKPNATLGEFWFDNTIPFNSGLVAIIGNKGKGKSALADIMGLLANTKQHANFTFLSSTNFRQQRDNKARHFRATLVMESGTSFTKGLEEAVDERQPEMVKYIPQNFLEEICTQLGKIEESEFDREIKKVIFSHVEDPYTLGQTTLDGLIAYRTAEATERIDLLKGELHRINEQIVALEDKAAPEYRAVIENLLEKKKNELAAHDAGKPAVIAKPENDPARQQQISTTSQAIEGAKATLLTEETNILQATQRKAALVQLIATADRVSGRLDNLNRQIQTFFTESAADLASLGLSADSVLRVTLDKVPLSEVRKTFAAEQGQIDLSLNPNHPNSLLQTKVEIEAAIKKLEDELDEPNQRYRAYETALKAWETQRLAITGSVDAADTIASYEAQLKDLSRVPEQLQKASEVRLAKAKEIHDVIRELADSNGKTVKVGDQLRKGKTVLSLYDFIFSLDYLKPRYALRMGTKELSELSPGERGTLLLVFYLLVDKDDIPLVIDQPEENLDNQTVFDLLVPCIKDARQRRQIIIVTHNPNLAVVCDADQVIHADLDKAQNYRMTYNSGSIENPSINKAIVDILEGTKPAFKNRDSKYL